MMIGCNENQRLIFIEKIMRISWAYPDGRIGTPNGEQHQAEYDPFRERLIFHY
jgi:hypothetical protein